MPVTIFFRHTPRHRAVLAATLSLFAAPAVAAADGNGTWSDAAAGQADPTVVITRTVHPRVAYRSVAKADNPVATEATVFPGQVFHGTLGLALGGLVDDGALDQRGSAGAAIGQTVNAALSAALAPLAGNAVGGRLSAGPSAAAGGATVALGGLIRSSVMQAVVMPRPATPGGGP